MKALKIQTHSISEDTHLAIAKEIKRRMDAHEKLLKDYEEGKLNNAL